MRLYAESWGSKPIISLFEDNPLPVQYMSFSGWNHAELQFFYNCGHINVNNATAKTIMSYWFEYVECNTISMLNKHNLFWIALHSWKKNYFEIFAFMHFTLSKTKWPHHLRNWFVCISKSCWPSKFTGKSTESELFFSFIQWKWINVFIEFWSCQLIFFLINLSRYQSNILIHQWFQTTAHGQISIFIGQSKGQKYPRSHIKSVHTARKLESFG